LKNLVSAAHGAKHSGSADGPATISGPAAYADETDTATAMSAPRPTQQARCDIDFMLFLPGNADFGIYRCSGMGSVLFGSVLFSTFWAVLSVVRPFAFNLSLRVNSE
jgi:hypothetical protein